MPKTYTELINKVNALDDSQIDSRIDFTSVRSLKDARYVVSGYINTKTNVVAGSASVHALLSMLIESLLNTYRRGGYHHTPYTLHDANDTDTLRCNKIPKDSFIIKNIRKGQNKKKAPNVQLNPLSIKLFTSWLDSNRLTGRIAIDIIYNITESDATYAHSPLFTELTALLWSKVQTIDLHTKIGESANSCFLLRNHVYDVVLKQGETLHLGFGWYEHAAHILCKKLGVVMERPCELKTRPIYPGLTIKQLNELDWGKYVQRSEILQTFVKEYPEKQQELQEQQKALDDELQKPCYDKYADAYVLRLENRIKGIRNDK